MSTHKSVWNPRACPGSINYTPRKLSLQGQRVARQARHSTFTEAYLREKRRELIWGSVLMLLMVLAALLPIALILYAKYGGN
jgi:VIT1/CCC1 family predicted Fe2+/Mn2+ transporter